MEKNIKNSLSNSSALCKLRKEKSSRIRLCRWCRRAVQRRHQHPLQHILQHLPLWGVAARAQQHTPQNTLQRTQDAHLAHGARIMTFPQSNAIHIATIGYILSQTQKDDISKCAASHTETHTATHPATQTKNGWETMWIHNCTDLWFKTWRLHCVLECVTVTATLGKTPYLDCILVDNLSFHGRHAWIWTVLQHWCMLLLSLLRK